MGTEPVVPAPRPPGLGVTAGLKGQSERRNSPIACAQQIRMLKYVYTEMHYMIVASPGAL